MNAIFAGRSLALLTLANISMQNDTNSATHSDISQSSVDGDFVPFLRAVANIWRSFSVKRYFCRRLRGFSTPPMVPPT